MEKDLAPSVVGFFWLIGNIGKEQFVRQASDKYGPWFQCDVNTHGIVATAFTSLAWAILHPWLSSAAVR